MKNYLLFIVFCLFVLYANTSTAQNNAQSVLNVNNVNATFCSNGNHFWDFQGFSLYEIPKGSGKHTIFCNALWLSGRDSAGNLYVSADRYRSTGNGDFTTGPLSTDGSLTTDQQTIDDYDYIWEVSKAAIDTHIAWTLDPSSLPNYTIPASIGNWPAHGDTAKNQSYYLAPFTDVDNNGVYEPQNGDYPKIRGDQALFFIFNDAGSPNDETGGTPPGVEIHAMAYAFGCPKSEAFYNTTFVHYKIFNRSGVDYQNFNIGLFADFDLGAAMDDYIACDVQRGSMYVYNGEDEDGNGGPGHYGMKPPAQSLVLLGGPLMDADTSDNPAGQCDESINGMNFGNGVVDDERLGMTRFISFNNSGSGTSTAITDPDTASGFNTYLNGLWKDSSAILYGGSGYSASGAYGPACRFMYPADTDTCHWGTGGVAPNGPSYWTEEVAGNVPYDRRGLAVTGPVTFKANSYLELDFAFVYGRDLTAPDSIGRLASVDKMKMNIDSIRYGFYNNITPCGDPVITSLKQVPCVEDVEITLYPNPVSEILHVKSSDWVIKYEVYNILGTLILSGESKMSKELNLDVSSLAKGLYVLKIQTDNRDTVRKFIKQ